MKLRECLARILSNYLEAKNQPFPSHSLARFIRQDFPQILKGLLEDPEIYLFKGSAGQSKWANCPWVAIFDSLITETAQTGFYPVYLFREDMSGVYLSLNQGVTKIKENYKENPKKVLEIKAAEFRAQLGSTPKTFPKTTIDLNTKNPADLASFYESGNIFAKLYEKGNLPLEDELVYDFVEMMEIYNILSNNDFDINTPTPGENIEVKTGQENLKKLKQHWRVERNQKLAKAAKSIHGYICQACGFNFEKYYGSIGKEFIEAHHLIPISQLKGRIVERDPRKDFAVLCSNCHRMIHKTDNPADIKGFQTRIQK